MKLVTEVTFATRKDHHNTALICSCDDFFVSGGVGTLAGHIEMVGKLEILLLTLPLIEEILATAQKLLEMGG